MHAAIVGRVLFCGSSGPGITMHFLQILSVCIFVFTRSEPLDGSTKSLFNRGLNGKFPLLIITENLQLRPSQPKLRPHQMLPHLALTNGNVGSYSRDQTILTSKRPMQDAEALEVAQGKKARTGLDLLASIVDEILNANDEAENQKFIFKWMEESYPGWYFESYSDVLSMMKFMNSIKKKLLINAFILKKYNDAFGTNMRHINWKSLEKHYDILNWPFPLGYVWNSAKVEQLDQMLEKLDQVKFVKKFVANTAEFIDIGDEQVTENQKLVLEWVKKIHPEWPSTSYDDLLKNIKAMKSKDKRLLINNFMCKKANDAFGTNMKQIDWKRMSTYYDVLNWPLRVAYLRNELMVDHLDQILHNLDHIMLVRKKIR